MSASASVTGRNVWLTSVDDDTDSLVFPTQTETRTPSVPVEARPYANGRVRMIRRAGGSQTVQVKCPRLDRAGVAWIEAHAGTELLLRDPRGLGVYGFYSDPAIEEFIGFDGAAVTLSFTSITVDESV